MIDTGFALKSAIRDDTATKGLLKLELDIGQILNYVDGIPQIARESTHTDASVANAGVYLLGSLDIGIRSRSLTGSRGAPALHGDSRTIFNDFLALRLRPLCV